jgi:hypothetical protein
MNGIPDIQDIHWTSSRDILLDIQDIHTPPNFVTLVIKNMVEFDRNFVCNNFFVVNKCC